MQKNASGRSIRESESRCISDVSLRSGHDIWNGSASGTGIFHDQQYADSCSWKSSHWCEADKGIDAIYAAAQVISAIHDLNESFGKQHPDAGKYIVGAGTIHGGEYTNIIADHVVLNGNIRAVHEETYMALEHELERNLQEIEKQTGTQIRMEFPKDPVYAFANDEELTETAKAVGEEVFGDKFVLEGEDELFLSGDNAYRYFRETRGLFTVFSCRNTRRKSSSASSEISIG